VNITSYKQAVAGGLLFYFNGRQCCNGHYSIRRTSNRECVECGNNRKRATNREQYLKHKEKRLEKSAEYREKNKKILSKKSAEYIRQRRNSDALFAIKDRLSSRVRDAFLAKGVKKKTSTQVMLGCNIEEFKAHIERQFLRGMNWENSGLWHIDHIVPCASASDESELTALFHFTNLRPVWAKENLTKSGKRTFLI
jgi:hypothetical protein